MDLESESSNPYFFLMGHHSGSKTFNYFIPGAWAAVVEGGEAWLLPSAASAGRRRPPGECKSPA